ncbi:hypothetical protein [Pleionea sediminis]|uniref:hypothetical protein n=1 Tax=Pleionea sediminis TaxID=2569479 RepID=UPI001186F048|nr:hypothetical protein [Pleionea sediminis]
MSAKGRNKDLLTIGANQTGDMYHLKAALALEPNNSVVIWNSDQFVKTADDIAKYLRPSANSLDLVNGDAMKNKGIHVGKATSLIAEKLQDPLQNFQVLDQKIRTGMATGVDGLSAKYAEDLNKIGFKQGIPYVLVNYRNVADKPGGVHPEHDTGDKGFKQLMQAAKSTGAVPVPMGDPPEYLLKELLREGIMTEGQANLSNYWKLDSAKGGRNQETGLIQHLAKNFNVVSGIGMRSGTLDMLAFVGIPIVSLDKDPKGKEGSWLRTTKLESAYGSGRYGTLYVNRLQADKGQGKVLNDGEFSKDDFQNISSALRIRRYSDTGFKPVDFIPIDNTHPFKNAGLAKHLLDQSREMLKREFERSKQKQIAQSDKVPQVSGKVKGQTLRKSSDSESSSEPSSESDPSQNLRRPLQNAPLQSATLSESSSELNQSASAQKDSEQRRRERNRRAKQRANARKKLLK